MLLKNAWLIGLISAGVGSGILFVNNSLTAAPIKPGFGQGMGCLSATGTGRQMPMMMRSMQVQNEAEYLSKMIPHHQEAVSTAKILEAGTKRPEMKQFARDIIRTQSAEIAQMQAWLKQWYPQQKIDSKYTPMMRDLTNLKGDDLDQAFLIDMHLHHKGAIMMSQWLLNDNLVKHNEVKNLATQISITQHNEIHQMQAWLRNWFGSPGMMGGMGFRGGMGNW